MRPLQPQVLRHVLVHDGVGLAAVEHVLEVVPVDDLEEGDVVVLGAVEGDDEEDVVVDVAQTLAVAVPEVDARAEALDGPEEVGGAAGHHSVRQDTSHTGSKTLVYRYHK